MIHPNCALCVRSQAPTQGSVATKSLQNPLVGCVRCKSILYLSQMTHHRCSGRKVHNGR